MIVNPPTAVAAVDLGSNSFHMIVADLKNDEIHVVDRIKEMVRLGAGLDDKGNLTKEAQQRALDCLERFGQRLRGMPLGSVRCVGTNTMRSAKNAREFLPQAEKALGHPIDIIAGIEEARLLYLGVARSIASDGKRRLVMDIGGGSTEFIIGTDVTPLTKESLNMGCVSMSRRHFANGKITAKRFKAAVTTAQLELEPFAKTFHHTAWEEAIGASGTLRSVRSVLLATGWSRDGITLEGLEKLKDAMIEAGHVDHLELPELSLERVPVFAGGVAIIYAAFKMLDIDIMRVADGALREGLLYELIGRIFYEDTRTHSVKVLAERYHVDSKHALRVIETVHKCLEQVSVPEKIGLQTAQQWLSWAAQLHEIGLSIAHNQYHKHGAYIIENADLPGFSMREQEILAALVKTHRRKVSVKLFKGLIPPWDKSVLPLVIIFRLAVLLHRGRQVTPIPDLKLEMGSKLTRVHFPEGWLEAHPLTLVDLEQEADYLAAAKISFSWQ